VRRRILAMQVRNISGNAVMQLIEKGAKYLDSCKLNLHYVNGGMVAYTLRPVRNGFELGATKAAMAEFPNAQDLYRSVITGKVIGGDVKAANIGVETNTPNWLSHTKTFGRYVDERIEEAKRDMKAAANAMVYPLCRHTLKSIKPYGSGLHKPCAVYWQYQYAAKENLLSLIINYRAQHLYALGQNLQMAAITLLIQCFRHECDVGPLTLLCNNHHIAEGEDAYRVCGKWTEWYIKPCKKQEMLRSVDDFFGRLK
jgi:hypothetical protein